MATVAPCCPGVLESHLPRGDAATLASAFKALGDPGRLRLLSFIAGQPLGEACVCHLTSSVDLSQPTVSHHLKLLHAAGLIDREKRGAWVYYRVVPERLAMLAGALAVAPARRHRGARRRRSVR